MGLAYFDAVTETPTRSRYQALPATGGPWDPGLQHGGPPNALLIDAAERLAASETGRSDLVAVRTAAEFLRAVPVSAVEVEARVVRSARSAALVEAALSAAGERCLLARVWFVAPRDTRELVAAASTIDLPAVAPSLNATFPYAASIEWRVLAGDIDQPGPGTVWARPHLSIVDGRELSGLQRAALIGDSASGVSSVLDWTQWSFLNIDLDVHLARPVRGEWLLMEAMTQLGTHGSALARSTLSDLAGPVGGTAQTLVVAPRRR
jgi:acyl-coenzyme A thioesterase PaaI-like protein